jgi:O-6-methylguanine DNA methyltransferase
MKTKPPPRFARFDTRIGRCAVAWSDRGVVGVLLPEASDRALAKRVQEKQPGAVESEPTESIRAAIDGIRALFDGEIEAAHAALAKLELDDRDVPAFHRKVYAAARAIAPGSTSSYRALAEAAGSALASRAVGQSMARNPFPIVVPCHRVLAADRRIGGFSAPGGVETKLRMLAIERDAALRAKSAARFAYDPERAVAHLSDSDPSVASLIARTGPLAMKLDPTPSVFTALAQAIAYQQLTGRAAETIWTRVCALFPYRPEGPDPARVAKASIDTLRTAGLSTAKARAISDLARKCQDGTVPALDALDALSDEEIIAKLTAVRGVGRWTAEMLLMFRLGRGDVFPVDDYGVQKGFQAVYGGELPSKQAMIERAQRWSPYRSVASWYLWRASEAQKSER